MQNEETKDINEIFDNICLTEETLSKEGYSEGYSSGLDRGSLEGYQTGYLKGVELGEELGLYYGTAIAHLQSVKSLKSRAFLEQFRATLEKFPRTNDPNIDLIAEIQNIRTQFKRIKAILRIPENIETSKSKDLSF